MPKTNQIEELVNQIKYHNFQYWNINNPEINDIEFDCLLQQLKELDPTNLELNYKGNYSQIVKSNSINKVKHDPPMLSLDKVYSPDQLIKWAMRVARSPYEVFKLQPKFDGIAGKINLETGILSTSGNTGYEGENITHKLELIKLQIKEPNTNNEVLGEIICDKPTFRDYKDIMIRKNGKPYKVPRSAVIGLLALDTPPDQKLNKKLTFIDYNVVSTNVNIDELKLIDWDKYIQSYKEWFCPVDGLVLKLNDEKYFKKLGNTSHHYRGQMALKLGNPTGITKLIDIQLQSGKESITPVGIIENVIIEGIDNQKISLHNFKYIIDNDICIGDTIEIERCGEIIPQFKRIIKKLDSPNRNIISELICPDCNGQLTYVSPTLKCTNENCSGKIIRLLTDSVVRIGIEELGPGTIKKLVLEQGITSLKEILDLEFNDIILLSGFSDKSAENLISEIEKIKNNKIYDYNILSSFNISGIGNTLSRKILKLYNIFELAEMSIDELITINGIGTERASLIHEFMNNYFDQLTEIYNGFDVIESKTEEISNKQNVCFTGKDDNPRSYWVKLAEENEFNYLKSVTKELNILVTNDVYSTSSKLKKASKYGCTIITYDQFTKLLKV